VLLGAGGFDRWGARWEIQTLEDRARGVGRMDRGEEPCAGAAAWALEHVDGEDPTEQIGPGQAAGPERELVGGRQPLARVLPSWRRQIPVFQAGQCPPRDRGLGLGEAPGRAAIGRPGSARHRPGLSTRGREARVRHVRRLAARLWSGDHPPALTRTRAEHPVVADEVEARRRCQRCELLDELAGLEDDVGGAIAPAVLQAIESRPSAIRERRSVATGGRAT